MTDRIHSLVVTLEDATRADDVQDLINAIKQLRLVADVQTKIPLNDTLSKCDFCGNPLNVLNIISYKNEKDFCSTNCFNDWLEIFGWYQQ